jgi:hypothetical protein
MPMAGIIFAICVAYNWEHSPVQMIDGHPNNGPWHASIILFGLSVLVYFPLLLINFICLKIYQSKGSGFFLSHVVAIVACASLLSLQRHKGPLLSAFGFGLILSAIFILPMALCSWAIKHWLDKRPTK